MTQTITWFSSQDLVDPKYSEIARLKRDLAMAEKDRDEYKSQAVRFADRLYEMTLDRDAWKAMASKIEEAVTDQAKPWEALGIPRRTYFDRKKKGEI